MLAGFALLAAAAVAVTAAKPTRSTGNVAFERGILQAQLRYVNPFHPLTGLPPIHSLISFEPVTRLGTTLRHCNYVTSTCPPQDGNEDYIFKLVPALNKAPSPAFSIQSTNFPGNDPSACTPAQCVV